MPDGTTTIEIFESDRDRLESLRRYPDEPHQSIVHRLLDENESLSPVALADIQASLDEIRRGEFVTHEALKRDLGIE
jgi:predicted transcriptional regulator